MTKKFEKAIAYLREKVPMPTKQWDDFVNKTQDYAFTIAGVEKKRILEQVQTELVKVLNGESEIDSFKAFAENFVQIMSSGGYGVTPWRAKLVYSQNLSTAYAAGRHKEMTTPEALEINPYWQYKTGYPLEPRPHHAVMNGKVYRAEDIIKAKWGLPSGFLCRCRWLAVSQDTVEDEGLTVENLPPIAVVNDRKRNRTYSSPLSQGKPLIEPGFHRIPGVDGDYKQEILKEVDDA